jgi:hypothetical protein
MAHRMPIVAVASKKIAVGTTVASMSPGRPRRATAPRSRGVANAEAVSAGTFSVRGRNIHACGGFHVLCTLRPFARRPVLFVHLHAVRDDPDRVDMTTPGSRARLVP